MELDQGPWTDRAAAGRDLGRAVKKLLTDQNARREGEDSERASDTVGPAPERPSPPAPLVLGLPRGGVVVAAEVAEVTGGVLDVLVVKKAGVPWHPELALGAVTASGVRVRNTDVIRHARLDEKDIESAFAQAEHAAQDREHQLREGRPAADISGRIVVIVDDGIATGATALAAAQLLRNAQPSPARVVLAVPVAPPDTVRRLSTQVDDLVVLRKPEGFAAVGEWFTDFTQVDDTQVRQLMARQA